MSFPYHVRGRARKELGRKWGLASARSRAKLAMLREPDWFTVCKRAAHDMRGQVLRDGATYYGDGRESHWSLNRSFRGRLDQVELQVNGAHWRTGSMRAACAAIRWRVVRASVAEAGSSFPPTLFHK